MKKILGIGSQVKHPEFGDGVVIQITSYHYTISFLNKGIREVEHEDESLEVTNATELEHDLISLFEVERTIVDVIRKFSDFQETIEMGSRWNNGKIILQPADPNLKGKEIPIDAFFNKIVMIRDRLRVLEQRINSHEKLTEEDKVNIQQYITRIYGSLTTFNVLFKNQKDYFVGEKGKV